MTQNAVPDTTAGDPTPELTQSSLIKAVTMLNKVGFNIEIPNTGTVGPIQIKRGVVVSGMTPPPVPNDGYGIQLVLSHGILRSTLLQQSANTNDERIYLLNNASPTAGAYTGNFVYDKAGAAATHYLQAAGVHTFATAPVAGAVNDLVVFTERVKIDSAGLTVAAGNLALSNGTLTINTPSATNQRMIGIANSGNGSNLNMHSVGIANAFLAGTIPGDSVIRAETNNLAIGALAGNTIISTSTRNNARFNANGTVLFPGVNGATSTYGGFAVGNGITAVVGNGSNVASDAKAFWMYKDNAASFIGGGMQFNAQDGLDFWTGNIANNAWVRSLQLQTSGRVLFGGVQAATAIGDVHINQLGSDSCGSLSLTGASNTAYLLMGNRDSLGAAGPAMIVGANRQIQIGVGTSYVLRSGGTFTPVMTVDGTSGTVGIGLPNPQAYGQFAVYLSGTSGISQVAAAVMSPNFGGVGTLGASLGIYWGNNVFTGLRTVTGGDANNAGLAFMTASGGTSVEAARLDVSKNLSVRGDTLYLGSNTTNVLSCDGVSQTFVRGNLVALQSPVGVNYLLAQTNLITVIPDLQVNGTIISSRQIEKTTDKTIGSGVVVFDYNTTSLWMCLNATANFTANFTNIPTTNNQATTVSIVLHQNSTGYWPSAVQINGAAVTVRWAGGMAPVPTPANIDLFQFTIIRTSSSTWTVLGSATPYV